ncbi:MAG: hypothetical protein R3C53_22530 [Pirellulaceae bacterium]
MAYERFGAAFKEVHAKREHFGHTPLYEVGLYFSSRTREKGNVKSISIRQCKVLWYLLVPSHIFPTMRLSFSSLRHEKGPCRMRLKTNGNPRDIRFCLCSCLILWGSVGLPLSLCGQAPGDEFAVPTREWKNLEGKKISAPVARVSSKSVVFLIDGREVVYPINRLSEEDQEFLEQLHPKSRSAVTASSVKFLCIRVNFADRQIFPQGDKAWKLKLDALFAFAEPYYRFQSYGQIARMPHETTEVFFIDKSWTTYKGKEGELADEMRKRAQAAGWSVEEFDHVVLSFPSIDGSYGALGTPGTIWMPGDNPWPPGFAHELGHAFGVGHAGTWEGGEAAWPGVHDEGSDANFTMGSGEVGAAWNLPMKVKLGWVPKDKLGQAKSGTKSVHRIYQFDTPILTDFGNVGTIAGDFWLSYAPNQTHWVKDGVPRDVVRQGVFIHTLHGEITRLVDATPNSRDSPDRSQYRLDPFHDTKDAALTIGSQLIIDQSANHPSYELRITPLRIGKTRAFFWIDVEIDYREKESVSLLAEESFASKSRSGTGWLSRWEANQSAGSPVAVKQGLEYLGLASAGGALQVVASKDEKDTFEYSRRMQKSVGASSSNVWIAFLFQAKDRQVGDLFLQLGDNPSFGFGKPWGDSFGIYTSHSQKTVQDGQTHLVVARFDFDAAETVAYLWVDPKLGGIPPDASAVATHRAGFNMADTLKIVLQGYGHGSYVVDEIRVGTTFTAVTPLNDNH